MNEKEVKFLLENLKLTHLKDNLNDYLLDAESKELTYLEFLHKVLASEYEEKEFKEYKARVKQSNLPYYKDFSDFNFQPSISKKKINILRPSRNRENKDNGIIRFRSFKKWVYCLLCNNVRVNRNSKI